MMNCSYDAFNKSESYSPRKPKLAAPPFCPSRVLTLNHSSWGSICSFTAFSCSDRMDKLLLWRQHFCVCVCVPRRWPWVECCHNNGGNGWASAVGGLSGLYLISLGVRSSFRALRSELNSGSGHLVVKSEGRMLFCVCARLSPTFKMAALPWMCWRDPSWQPDTAVWERGVWVCVCARARHACCVWRRVLILKVDMKQPSSSCCFRSTNLWNQNQLVMIQILTSEQKVFCPSPWQHGFEITAKVSGSTHVIMLFFADTNTRTIKKDLFMENKTKNDPKCLKRG